MKGFFTLVRKSIYDPLFYGDIHAKSLKSSFGYFFLLVLFVAFVMCVVTSIAVVPRLASFLNGLGPQILNYYPDDLVITIKGGQVSTNVDEPYFFALPDGIKESAAQSTDYGISSGTLQNLLVIDTKDAFSLDLFKQYRTVAWLTRDSVAYYDKNSGAIRLVPLDKVPDGVFNKAKVSSIVAVADKVFKFIPALAVLFIFIGVFVWHAFELLYLVIGALLIWLIMKIKGIKSDYGTSYKIGLYAVTPALLATTLISFVGVWFPLEFTIVFVVMAAVNLKKA